MEECDAISVFSGHTDRNDICGCANDRPISCNNEIIFIPISSLKCCNEPFCLPPKQAPKDNAHVSGCSGKFNTFFSANEITIRIIIVVSGILSTNAETIAETHSIISIATVKRNSSDTDKMIFSVRPPIRAIRPSRAKDSINTNNTAKNSSVDHSTWAKIGSILLRSARIKSKRA